MANVNITFTTGGRSITLPVNPENIAVNVPGNNETTEVVKLGQIVIPRLPNLRTVSIERWFDNDSYTTFFKNAFKQGRILRMVTTGMKLDAMRVVIQSFEYEKRAGEESDTYYKLDLIEYRPYGAKLMPVVLTDTATPTAKPMAAMRTTENKPEVGTTYTTKPGDSIQSITQKLGGGTSTGTAGAGRTTGAAAIGGGAGRTGTSGTTISDEWKSLYNENKVALGNSPNKLAVGTTINVPRQWQTATTPSSAGAGAGRTGISGGTSSGTGGA